MSYRFWWVVGVAAAAAGADLLIGLRSGLAPVPEVELADARRALEVRMKGGETIVHSPLLGVEELQHLGRIRSRPDLPVASVRESRRILLLDRRDAPMYGFRKPDDEIIVGPHLMLAIFEPRGTAEVSVFDLVARLEPNTMRLEKPPGKLLVACRQARAEGGFRCPGQADWLYAAPQVLRVNGESRECLWAHPMSGGAVVFSIPGQDRPPPGRQLVLELEGALTDDAVRQTPDGAPVTTVVRQGGRMLGRISVPNRVGWSRFSGVVKESSPVELVTTAPRDGRRHYCLNARIIERQERKGSGEVP